MRETVPGGGLEVNERERQFRGPRRFRGKWWHSENPGQTLRGDLEIRDDHRSILDLHGQFMALPWDEFVTIYGETDEGRRVTLRRALRSGFLSLDPPPGGRTVVEAYETLLGVWEVADRPNVWSGLAVSIDGLVEWLRRGDWLKQEWNTEKNAVCIRPNRAESQDCEARIDGVTVVAGSRSPVPLYDAGSEIVVGQVAWCSAKADEPRSLEYLLDFILGLRALLWLCRLEPAGLSPIHATPDRTAMGEEGEQDDHGKPDVVWFVYGITSDTVVKRWETIPCIFGPELAERFQEVFAAWSASRKAMPSVHELYFLPRRGVPLTDEVRFLNLVQVVEGYARTNFPGSYIPTEEWECTDGPCDLLLRAIPADLPQQMVDALKARIRFGNSATCRTMVRRVVEAVPQVCEHVLRSPKMFADDVADWRNALVHVLEDRRPHLETLPPLARMSRYLEVLLHLRLLSDSGCGDDQLQRILKENWIRSRFVSPEDYWSPLKRHYHRPHR